MDNWFTNKTIEDNYDEIYEKWLTDFEYKEIPLSNNKKIKLFRIYEVDNSKNTCFIRNEGITIDNMIIVSNFSDVVLLMEELNLFDAGSENNKYFTIVEQNKIKSLKLKLGEKSIYISKSEARAMFKIYNLSRQGYTFNRVIENEYRFTTKQINSIKNQ